MDYIYPTQLAEENPLKPNPSVLYLQSTAIDRLLAGTVNTSMEVVSVSAFPSPFVVPFKPTHIKTTRELIYIQAPTEALEWFKEAKSGWATPTSPSPHPQWSDTIEIVFYSPCRHSAKPFFLGLDWLLALLRLWWTTAWDLVMVGKLWIGRLSRNLALGFIDRSLYW